MSALQAQFHPGSPVIDMPFLLGAASWIQIFRRWRADPEAWHIHTHDKRKL